MITPNLVIVSGMSGAGRSTTLQALEDLDFYCIDNAPPSLVTQAVDECLESGLTEIALGIGARAGRLHEGIESTLTALATRALEFTLVFLDASDAALLRRFSSTRRPHPLESDGRSKNQARAVLDAIHLERELLAPLRARAHQLIDTTDASVHDLRKRVISLFGSTGGNTPALRTRFMSFGFKYGTPIDTDLVFDVRFLDNPYFVENLRPLSGLDEPVRKFVLGQADSEGFVTRVAELLAYTLPLYQREGKRYLTVGIGCTGGRHRSVALAVRLAAEASQRTGFDIDVVHRDITREGT